MEQTQANFESRVPECVPCSAVQRCAAPRRTVLHTPGGARLVRTACMGHTGKKIGLVDVQE